MSPTIIQLTTSFSGSTAGRRSLGGAHLTKFGKTKQKIQRAVQEVKESAGQSCLHRERAAQRGTAKLCIMSFLSILLSTNQLMCGRTLLETGGRKHIHKDQGKQQSKLTEDVAKIVPVPTSQTGKPKIIHGVLGIVCR